MATSIVASSTKDSRRRTNSLGFAKIDCHTCSTLSNRCDRQRPRCGTCLTSGRKCGGFALDLVWKDVTVSPESTDISHEHSSSILSPGQGQTSEESHEYKFVRGRAKRKRETKKPTWGSKQFLSLNDTRPFLKSPILTVTPRSATPGAALPYITTKGTIYNSHDVHDDELVPFCGKFWSFTSHTRGLLHLYSQLTSILE